MSVRLLKTGESALDATSKALESAGNNIANVSTAGFKAARVKYSNRFYEVLSSSLPATANGAGRTPVAIGLGTSLAATVTDFSDGNYIETGDTNNVAIRGGGFLKARDITTGKTYATRSGQLKVDTLGYLVTTTGERIQGLSGGDYQFQVTKVNNQYEWTMVATTPPSSNPSDIMVQPGPLTGSRLINLTGDPDSVVIPTAPTSWTSNITQTGAIQITFGDQSSFTIGNLLLLNFNDPTALTPEENGLYSGFDSAGQSNTFDAAGATPGQNGLGKLLSGGIEGSNVDLTREFTDLITTQRAFQAGARLIDTASEVLSTVVRLGS